jgi:hypothetical protein
VFLNPEGLETGETAISNAVDRLMDAIRHGKQVLESMQGRTGSACLPRRGQRDRDFWLRWHKAQWQISNRLTEYVFEMDRYRALLENCFGIRTQQPKTKLHTQALLCRESTEPNPPRRQRCAGNGGTGRRKRGI